MPDVPPLTVVAERMRPGAWSRTGFLGPDEDLAELIACDAAALVAIRVAATDLASALGTLIEPLLSPPRTRARLGRHVVTLARYKGSQRCPFTADTHSPVCSFGGATRLASLDWTIRNSATGEALSGPGLIVHLIGVHGFFNGRRTAYRVEPRALARLLELGSAAAD